MIEHPAIDLRHALDVALNRDDLRLAWAILEHVNGPQQYYSEDKDEIRSQPNFALRRKILYPPHAVRRNESNLDRALRMGSMREAKAELKNGMPGIFWAWLEKRFNAVAAFEELTQLPEDQRAEVRFIIQDYAKETAANVP